MVDTYSKFVLLAALPDCTAATVGRCIRERFISVFGIPLSFRVDNGTEFAGGFSQLLGAYHITHNRSSVAYPQANG